MRTEVGAMERPKSLAGLWLFLALWWGITGLFLWAIASGHERRWPVVLIIFLFAVIGLALAAALAWMTLGQLKFGSVHLYVDEPLVIGGRLAGSIVVPRGVTATRLTASLHCRTGSWTSPPNSVYGEMDRWTTSAVVPIHPAPDGARAEIAFQIPADQPATDLPGADTGSTGVGARPNGIVSNHPYFCWMLQVRADEPGADLARAFRLRVSRAA